MKCTYQVSIYDEMYYQYYYFTEIPGTRCILVVAGTYYMYSI